MLKKELILILLLFLGHCKLPAAASSSRLASLARIATNKQSLLYPFGRTGIKLGKWLGSQQPTYGYGHIRLLSSSSTPYFFSNPQKYFSNMTKNIPTGFNFWSQQQTKEPISLTSIRKGIHEAHEYDKQGKPLLPKKTKVEIAQALNDPAQAESFLAELNSELANISQEIADHESQKSWYQERGAQKLWQAKLKEFQDESYELQLINQFILLQQR